MLRSLLQAVLRPVIAIFGFFLALFLVGAFLGLFVDEDKDDVERQFTPRIIPDADLRREPLATKLPVILQLNIHGVIGVDSLTQDKVRQQLVESREGKLHEDRVHALFLHINSPGGVATDANAIYHAIMDYKRRYRVPVYAYVDGMCASGGYMIALAADKIFASEVSLVGSVGVIMPTFFNVKALLDSFGISSKTIAFGKNKDELNPFRQWKEEEGAPIAHIARSYYDSFVDMVAKHRMKPTAQQLKDTLGASVYPALEAEELGFIDQAPSSREEALKALVDHLQLSSGNYRVVEMERKWWGDLFQMKNTLFQGTVHHTLDLHGSLPQALEGKFLYLYQPVEL